MVTKYKNVYVTLDSLVDVKLTLAILAGLSLPELTDDFLLDYITRKRDNVGKIPYSVIDDLYRRFANIYLLKSSSPTPLLHNVIVEDFELLQNEAMKDKKLNLNNKLIINTHPYELDDNIITYLKILASEVLPDVETEVVRLSISEVSAKWIVENNIVIFYDYHGADWIAYHTNLGDIIDTPVKNTLFCFPKIDNGMLPLTEITDDYFREAEDMSSGILSVKHLPVYFFSTFIKDFYFENQINEIYEGDIKVNIAKENEIIKEKKNERDFKPTDRTTNTTKW